jgi:hypothetical protein
VRRRRAAPPCHFRSVDALRCEAEAEASPGTRAGPRPATFLRPPRCGGALVRRWCTRT